MDNQHRALEFVKLYYDYSKHQTTLSATTAVVLVALFREDAPWVPLILLALSAVLALRVMLGLASSITLTPETVPPNIGLLLQALTTSSWLAWVVAIVWAVVAVASDR